MAIHPWRNRRSFKLANAIQYDLGPKIFIFEKQKLLQALLELGMPFTSDLVESCIVNETRWDVTFSVPAYLVSALSKQDLAKGMVAIGNRKNIIIVPLAKSA